MIKEQLKALRTSGGVEIMKASAGSGKTYSLSREYIRVLLKGNCEERNYHRHILAVTFTNKATDNMKTAIVEALDLIGRDPDRCEYSQYLVDECGFSGKAELKKAASAAMNDILNDYSAFSVSTIDKFFQRTLKSFAREIGQTADYRVELDRNSIIDETVDSVLDSLTEDDRDLLKWLSDSSVEKLEAGEGYHLESALGSFARSYLSPEYEKKRKDNGIDEDLAFTESNLKKLSGICRNLINDYLDGINTSAARLYDALRAMDIFDDGVVSSIKTSLNEFKNLKGRKPEKFNATWKKACADTTKLFKSKYAGKIDAAELTELSAMVAEVEKYDVDGQMFRLFRTAQLLSGQVYVFRTAEALKRHHIQVLKERNVLGIDDTNEILRDLIGGTEIPFIYEKTGTRYKHFLLDEFQDTSVIQWECFRPLLANSIAEGCYNLIVGDVKQSIYRWRDADWHIFGEQVEKEMRNPVVNRLEVNWRSSRNIVRFNNNFFNFLSEEPVLNDIYSDAGQEPSESVSEKLGIAGCVDLTRCERQDMNIHVLNAVRGAHERGFSYGDIAVIVKTHKTGGEIAEVLTRNGIKVVTDDSLRIGSSSCVRKVVKGLVAIDDPQDIVNTYGVPDFDYGFVAGSRSILETADGLMKQLDRDEINSETIYILAFMDLIRDFTSNGGNSLHEFLKFWNEKGCDKDVACPADKDAVTIITIHKSKGIEYPYVIVPVSYGTEMKSDTSRWEIPQTEGSPFEECEKAVYNIRLDEKSLFSEGYREEKEMSRIDYVNEWYVAFTRPKEELRIIVPNGTCPIGNALMEFAGRSDSGFREAEPEEMTGKTVRFIFGEPSAKSPYRKNEGSSEELTINYIGEDGPSYKAGVRISGDASDYFSYGSGVSPRKRGIILHGILESVVSEDDLAQAVDNAVEDGRISPDMRESVHGMLSGAIASVAERGWFSKDCRVFSERDILSAGANPYRPDRIVIRDGSVDVIDYKFAGYNKKYYGQVSNYMKLYSQMGYSDVHGYIWYVDEDKVSEVIYESGLFD